MTKVFELLEEVERRPGMYLGYSAEERGEQLKGLETLLVGYAFATRLHGIESESGGGFVTAFAEYLHVRFGWSRCLGPVAAIREAAKDDDDAWELFWKLVGEFRESLQSER